MYIYTCMYVYIYIYIYVCLYVCMLYELDLVRRQERALRVGRERELEVEVLLHLRVHLSKGSYLGLIDCCIARL